MKKLSSLLIVLIIMLTLASCKNSSEKKPDSEPTESVSVSENAEAVDIDLTKLSNTMVYSQLYNMVVSPDKYIGKTVRLRGKYGVYDGESGKFREHAAYSRNFPYCLLTASLCPGPCGSRRSAP